MHGFCFVQPQKPLMVMEYWSGWFDVWGEHHHVFHAEGTPTTFQPLFNHFPSEHAHFLHHSAFHSLYYTLTSSTMADVCDFGKPYECNWAHHSWAVGLRCCSRTLQPSEKSITALLNSSFIAAYWLTFLYHVIVYYHMVCRHASCCVRDPGERRLHQPVHVPRGNQLWLHEWSDGLWHLQASGHQLRLVRRPKNVSDLWWCGSL